MNRSEERKARERQMLSRAKGRYLRRSANNQQSNQSLLLRSKCTCRRSQRGLSYVLELALTSYFSPRLSNAQRVPSSTSVMY